MLSCVHHPSTVASDNVVGNVLESSDGFEVREIALQPDGSYKDTTSGDVIGEPVTIRAGSYILDAGGKHLALLPSQGEPENLYRVDYRGRAYWVWDRDRGGVEHDARVRQTSLKLEKP